MNPGTTTTAEPSPRGIPQPQYTGEIRRYSSSTPANNSCQMGSETDPESGSVHRAALMVVQSTRPGAVWGVWLLRFHDECHHTPQLMVLSGTRPPDLRE